MHTIVRLAAVFAGVLASACAASMTGASAQAYPTRPITMVVPFPAGGATDVLARFLGERMRDALGQPVIVENVSGAAGTLGVGRAVRAPADGYTLSIGTSTTHMLTGGLYNLPFDLINDLDPVILIGSEPLMILGKKTLPPNNLQELIAWLKANPDKASVGLAGVGAIGHLTGLAFQKATGTQYQFIPYRGNPPVVQDLVGGQLDFVIEPAQNYYTQVNAGTVKAYAVTAKQRIATVSQVPTVDEAGLPGFYASVWYGIWAPKGTPKEIITKLNALLIDIFSQPATRQNFAERGLEQVPAVQHTPEALRTYQKEEAERWWPIMKAANLKGQ
jgi:tripartite-type tricarboxylate transporter receptor subunit TctC